MKSDNKLYAFFIVIALLFWNPLAFYLEYGNTPAYAMKIMHLLYWMLFVLGLISIYLVNKGKVTSRIKNILLVLSFTGILYGGLVLVDLALGLLPGSPETRSGVKKKGLIFEPNTVARYKTVEYDHVAEINSLGLRDGEININKGKKYRILCFGDSWTYGWGVDLKDCWPKKLEAYLQKKGRRDIEVINCGRGGQCPTTYKEYMSRAVPLLKPDLVLVGVLQLDDLAQLYENKFLPFEPYLEKPDIMARVSFVLGTYLKCSFSNILYRIIGRDLLVLDVSSYWELTAKAKVRNFKGKEKRDYEALDERVKNLLLTGNLNPGILDDNIVFGDRVKIFNDPGNPLTIQAVKEMDSDIKSMKATCEEQNCRLVFVTMPTSYFTGHKLIRMAKDTLNTFFEKNNKIDSIYRSIAGRNGLDYLQLTEHFLSLKNKRGYYFLYDGHPNRYGYEEIANYIGAGLVKKNLIK